MNDHGFKVVAFNRTVDKVESFLANEAKGTQIIGAKSLQVWTLNSHCYRTPSETLCDESNQIMRKLSWLSGNSSLTKKSNFLSSTLGFEDKILIRNQVLLAGVDST